METILGRSVEGEESSNEFYKFTKNQSDRHSQTNSREAAHEAGETVDGGEEEENEQQIGEEESQGVPQDDGRVNRPGFVSWNVSDPEVLDCSICCEPMTIPVFQCENGHIACGTCCTGTSKCPYCSSFIGYHRCRAIEKVLESVQVKCRNTKLGCRKTFCYSKKRDHEKICSHAPCSCPLPDCNFIGTATRLHKHFSFRHKDAAVQFIYNRIIHISLHAKRKFIVLQEEKNGDIFILSNRIEGSRHGISIGYIAPSWKEGIFYSILTKSGGSSIGLKSHTKSIQNWEDNPASLEELLVPAKKFGYYGQLKLDIYIRR